MCKNFKERDSLPQVLEKAALVSRSASFRQASKSWVEFTLRLIFQASSTFGFDAATARSIAINEQNENATFN